MAQPSLKWSAAAQPLSGLTVCSSDGKPHERIQDIAFPHATGVRPYSYGLQACDAAAFIVVTSWQEENAVESDTADNGAALAKIYEDLADAS